jgi:transposase-like protein
MICPKCGSNTLVKRGKRAGKQRYRCANCRSSFTEGVPYKEAPKYTELDVACPKCGSSQVIREGKLEDGSPRYQCKQCNLNFSTKTNTDIIFKKEIKWSCPYCEGKLWYSGYNKKGDHIYICKKCGKTCSSDSEGKPIKNLPFYLTNTEVECPHCHSYNIKKGGTNEVGTHRYICRECGKLFNENTKEHLPKEQIAKDVLNGMSLQKASEKSGYSTEYIRKFMRPFYKEETITTKQKHDIIKYGFYLNVPVNYMAEYIKCSEYKCRSILKKFQKYVTSTNRDAI